MNLFSFFLFQFRSGHYEQYRLAPFSCFSSAEVFVSRLSGDLQWFCFVCSSTKQIFQREASTTRQRTSVHNISTVRPGQLIVKVFAHAEILVLLYDMYLSSIPRAKHGKPKVLPGEAESGGQKLEFCVLLPVRFCCLSEVWEMMWVKTDGFLSRWKARGIVMWW